MNKRIRKLAEQARKALATDAMSGGEFNMKAYEEKFAELIVRECATAITNDDLAKDCDTFLMDSYAKGMRYSVEVIKEHFGIE